MQIPLDVLRKVANKQTDKQTDKQQRKHNLLGGGNKLEAKDILPNIKRRKGRKMPFFVPDDLDL